MSFIDEIVEITQNSQVNRLTEIKQLIRNAASNGETHCILPYELNRVLIDILIREGFIVVNILNNDKQWGRISWKHLV